MIVYHGTTSRRAQRIVVDGFQPRKPSKRVWFAESKGYAEGRAKTQARRTRDRPVVLTCDLDLNQMRKTHGARKVMHRNRVIAIDAAVPVGVLRSWPASADMASSPDELAAWVNGILRVKPYKGVSPKHEGVQRLSRWIVNRMRAQPNSRIKPTEILQQARQWLPEFFAGVKIDPQTLHASRRMRTIEVEVEKGEPLHEEREYEALELLEHETPKRRVRGLRLLAELEDPDLFEWCAVFLDDESVDVRVAALKTIVHCENVDTQALEPFAGAEDKLLRAAALSALAKHSGEAAPRWFKRGLTDPYPNVRLETASLLPLLDPTEHKALFELALYDPNPHVRQQAEKMTQGKGYAKLKW